MKPSFRSEGDDNKKEQNFKGSKNLEAFDENFPTLGQQET
jgi:hypothetical protein